MGIVVRKKDGKWYVFINHKGRRKAQCVGDSKRAAEALKQKLELDFALGKLHLFDPTPTVTTFGAYAQQWLTTYAARLCKPSTQRVFASMLTNQLLPAFGAHDLTAITRAEVKAFVLAKAQRYTPAYVRNIIRTLHAIYAQAIDDALLTVNPAARLGRILPEPLATEQPHQCFSSAELARYLVTMQERYPQHYAYFLTLARTGMREGEALGLRWDDIQLGQDPRDPYRFLHVQRTYDPVHHVWNTPKSGKSRRVDMSQELRAALMDLYAQRCDQAALEGRTVVAPVVFCGATGQPLAAGNLYSIHRRVCTAAGLRATSIHALRHSYATIQLYEHHAPIQYVSEQLGHASISITVDTYGHPRQGTSIHLADQLDVPLSLRKVTP